MTAFDVSSGGSGELRYDSPGRRTAELVVQTVLWVLLLFAAMRVSVPIARRTRSAESDETLIRMTNEAFGRIMSSEDTSEGLQAFIEKLEIAKARKSAVAGGVP